MVFRKKTKDFSMQFDELYLHTSVAAHKSKHCVYRLLLLT